jgi:hypothetical protein
MRKMFGSILRWPVFVVLLSPTAICFDLGFFGKANNVAGAVFDPLHPHDYGVDVSTQIHGRLRKDTFHVRTYLFVFFAQFLDLLCNIVVGKAIFRHDG